MNNQPQTRGQKLFSGVLGVVCSIGSFACGIGLIVTGRAPVHGPGGFVTPQKDPRTFWAIIAICFVAGAITLVASIRALAKASNDDTP